MQRPSVLASSFSLTEIEGPLDILLQTRLSARIRPDEADAQRRRSSETSSGRLCTVFFPLTQQTASGVASWMVYVYQQGARRTNFKRILGGVSLVKVVLCSALSQFRFSVIFHVSGRPSPHMVCPRECVSTRAPPVCAIRNQPR